MVSSRVPTFIRRTPPRMRSASRARSIPLATMRSRRCCRCSAILSQIALKQRVLKAVVAGENPSVVSVTNHRFARTNIRVALRQLRASEQVAPALADWMAAHEPSKAEIS